VPASAFVSMLQDALKIKTDFEKFEVPEEPVEV
jgi:hypothetical protein